MDAALSYSVKRIIELEALLLPAVPETVWSAEVKSVFSSIERAGELPAHHQRRLLHHINRMWLDRLPVPSIVTAANSLCEAMEKYA